MYMWDWKFMLWNFGVCVCVCVCVCVYGEVLYFFVIYVHFYIAIGTTFAKQLTVLLFDLQHKEIHWFRTDTETP